VKKVDAAKGRVTIAHGPLKNLNMPPMTMVFRADSLLLANIAAGDKVRFAAEDQQGKMVVTAIEKAQ
ncbi:MAG TPA: copper-binding protein, partial [Rhodocyclaceae bacterium]